MWNIQTSQITSKRYYPSYLFKEFCKLSKLWGRRFEMVLVCYSFEKMLT